MSKIKYISFFKKDAVFDSERIVGELLDVCEQINLGEDGIMCRMQVVQGELVHCKDCKYWAELTFLVPPKHHCGRLLQQYKGISERVSFETDADDFCSRGELK